MQLGDKAVATDGFRGEIVTAHHGGTGTYTYYSAASEVNLPVVVLMAESGEIRHYRMDAVTVDGS